MAFNFDLIGSDGITSDPTAVGTADIGSGSFTLACWLDKDTVLGTRSCVNFSDKSNSRNYFSLGVSSSNNLEGRTRDSGGQVLLTSSATLSSNTWYHGALTMISSVTSAELFLDGVSVASTLVAKWANNLHDVVSLGLIRSTSDFQKFDGQLGEVGIWNAQLSDDEIAALAQGLSPLLVRAQSLLWYFPLNNKHDSVAGEAAFGHNFTTIGTPSATGPIEKQIFYPSGKQMPRPVRSDTIIGVGHEPGDFSEYDSNSGTLTDLSVTAAAALEGCYGMQIDLGTVNEGYYIKDFTMTGNSCRLRFKFDPNGFTTSVPEHWVRVVQLRNAQASCSFEFMDGDGAGDHNVRMAVFNGDLFGSDINTSEYSISDGPHDIDILWTREDSGSTNAEASLYVDDVFKETISNFNCNDLNPDELRVGLITAADDESGSVYIDEFRIRDGLLPFEGRVMVCNPLDITEGRAVPQWLGVGEQLNLTEALAIPQWLSVDQQLQVTEAVGQFMALAVNVGLDLTHVAPGLFTAKGVAETLGVSEGVGLAMFLGINDTLNASEALSLSQWLGVGEQVGVSEGVGMFIAMGVAEGLDLTDAIGKVVAKNINDTLGLSEGVGQFIGLGINQNIDLSDALGQAQFKGVADALDLSGGVGQFIALGIAQQIDVTDGVVIVMVDAVTYLIINEGLDLTGGIGQFMGLGAGEAMDLSAGVGLGMHLGINEQADILDALGNVIRKQAPAQSLDVSAGVGQAKFKGVNEQLDVTHTIGMGVAMGIQEAIDVQEQVATFMGLGIGQVIDLSDGVGQAQYLGIGETLDVGEGVVLVVTPVGSTGAPGPAPYYYRLVVKKRRSC